MSHKLKKFTWNSNEGKMIVDEMDFFSFDHVMEHLRDASGFDSFKIYDDSGELVHSGAPAPILGTYA